MAWIAAFLVLETWALIDRDRGDTLSESIWFLQRQWWPLTVILAVLFLFLIWHFVFDRRSRRSSYETETTTTTTTTETEYRDSD